MIQSNKQIRTFLLPLNLQLFAGEQSVEVDGQKIEIDDTDYSDDTDTDVRHNDDGSIEIGDADDDEEEQQQSKGQRSDQGDDEDGQHSSQHQETESSKEEVKQENPTAKAVIAERKRMQAKLEEANKKAAIAEKLLAMSGFKSVEELQAQLDIAEAQRIAQQSGITPQQAQLQLQQQRELENMRRDIRKQKYESEATRLKTDPFFADIDTYREEFEEIAERTGQSLEEVYWSKRGRERMKEREREIEQTLSANREKRAAAKVDTSVSAGTKPKAKHGLTSDELAIAKLAGISPEEYAKNKKK